MDSQLLTSSTKRDSLAAELERDPYLQSSKRHQSKQVFTSTIAHASLERQLLAARTANTELETKLRERDLLIERLERDRRYFADRESEERAEREKERQDYEDEKHNLEVQLRSTQSTLSILQDDYADLQDTHAALERTYTRLENTHSSQVNTLQHQVTTLTATLAAAEQTASNYSNTISELKDTLASRSSGETIPAENESTRIIRDELLRQVTHLRTVEAANARITAELIGLRARRDSVEVLQEEKRSLERKLVTLEEMRARVVRLEGELEAAHKEREEWTLNQNIPSKTPISITKTLSELRLTHGRLLEEHGATRALLRRSEVELSDMERQYTVAKESLAKAEVERRSLKEQINRKETSARLAEREIGFLRAQVASFDAEFQAREKTDRTESIDELKNQRIDQLETLLQDYKTVNEQLTAELVALGGDPSLLNQGSSREWLASEIEKERTKRAEIEEKLDAAEKDNAQHLAAIDALEQQLFELQGEIAGGRHVPPGVRVLSLRDNPEQQWVDLRQAAMDRLRGENEALMKRLREFEGRPKNEAAVSMEVDESNSQNLVPRESWELIRREKTELEEVVKQKEKRLLRLQQVFTSKSAEFRDAIASILGLKLAFYPNGQVRVTSMYDLCASFVFQPSKSAEGGTMQLIAQGEGGPQDLPDLMHYWIEKEQCIPGFLASVTLECYDKVKRDAEGA